MHADFSVKLQQFPMLFLSQSFYSQQTQDSFPKKLEGLITLKGTLHIITHQGKDGSFRSSW